MSSTIITKKIPFVKYHGTGNDFVLIDNRQKLFGERLPEREWVARCCTRRFGIGADGLILLQSHPQYDFEMVYFNADGGLGSMCGNGGRCVVAFAKHLGIIANKAHFWASDGEHSAEISEETGLIRLKMNDVLGIEKISEHSYFLNTGSPHYVEIVESLEEVPVVEWGRAIRYNDRFKADGTNVNFMQINNNGDLRVATYERGVEDETYSCGTGVTASAIVYACERQPNDKESLLNIHTKGGDLQVHFSRSNHQHFFDIWLCGPAVSTFEGTVAGC